MRTAISRAIAKAAITIAAAITAGALAYVSQGNPGGAAALVGATAMVMGFLAFLSSIEE